VQSVTLSEFTILIGFKFYQLLRGIKAGKILVLMEYKWRARKSHIYTQPSYICPM